MMTQKHIGYTSWNDSFDKDTCPETFRITDPTAGGYVHTCSDGVVVIEAEHYNTATTGNGRWTAIPHMGRTLSAMTVLPHSAHDGKASLTYRFDLPKDCKNVKIHVIVKSTLAFSNLDGHRYTVTLDNGDSHEINFNSRLNEDPDNVYNIFYPTVARRVVENTIKAEVPAPDANGLHTLTLTPLDPGIVFEKIVVDCGGYRPSYLHMPESPYHTTSRH